MCRLYGFRGSEATKVECTLARAQNALLIQSRVDLRGISHPDGWGIGYYPDGNPVVDRRAAAAHADLYFSMAAERVFSRTVVAHVRRATVGDPLLENAHPFTCGCWLFAHNGTVTGIDEVGPRLEAQVGPALLARRRGSTDSELAFYWLLSRIAQEGIDLQRPGDDLPALVRGVGSAVTTLAGWCARADSERPPRLNFLLTDGVSMVASRWNNSLSRVVREGIHDCEICGIPHVRHTPGVDYRAVVIASEAVSQEDWEEVPEQSLVAVDRELWPPFTPSDEELGIWRRPPVLPGVGPLHFLLARATVPWLFSLV